GDQVLTTNPLSQVVNDYRDGTGQGHDTLRSPVRHLSPAQQRAQERLRHQAEINRHTENPDQLPELAVRPVHQATQVGQIDHHEEGRSSRGVQITQQPAVFHITHDVFNGGKSAFSSRVVAHGQPDTGNDLVNQNKQRQGTKEVPEVKVLRSIVLAEVFFVGLDDRQTLIDPLNNPVH